MANTALNFSQANLTQQDAIVTAANPGVSPADYRGANHYVFHHRLGQNARCAPLLLGIDNPANDLSYPSNAFIKAIGPERWDVLSPNQHFAGTANSTFAALTVPPASMTKNTNFPASSTTSPPAGKPPFPGLPKFPTFEPAPEPDRQPPQFLGNESNFPTNPPFPKLETDAPEDALPL